MRPIGVTASRSELGLRTDKSFAMQTAILTLRGGFAWAHDFDSDRNIAAGAAGCIVRRQWRRAGA
jgi:uncharacterized protein with beta-barrel porin domain